MTSKATAAFVFEVQHVWSALKTVEWWGKFIVASLWGWLSAAIGANLWNNCQRDMWIMISLFHLPTSKQLWHLNTYTTTTVHTHPRMILSLYGCSFRRFLEVKLLSTIKSYIILQKLLWGQSMYYVSHFNSWCLKWHKPHCLVTIVYVVSTSFWTKFTVQIFLMVVYSLLCLYSYVHSC